MKKSKTWNRLAAVFLAGTMMTAMGTNVFAAGLVEDPTAITLTKTINAGDNVKAPNTNFNFSVSTAGEEKSSAGVVTAYAGKAGGLYFAEGKNSIQFTPADALSKTTQLSLDVSKFEKPGVYHYTVAETSGNYDGMTYDQKNYDVYVHVVNGQQGLEISAVESKYNDTKSDISFENTYATNKLTLKKSIKGNQAYLAKEFKFTVTIDGADGEQYIAKNGTSTQILTSGTSVDYYLGNEETVEIYGLSANDTYTIVEENCSDDGYKTTISGADETDGLEATGKVDIEKGESVIYTNTKEASTPTGIVTNALPYGVMVATASGLAFVFLRKKEYDR